jgi:HlyD family secretion protein
MRKKPLIIAGVVVLIALIAFFNIRFKKKSVVTVEGTEVQKRTVSKIVTASGSIKPKRLVNVSASAIGKVTTVAVEEGDRVKKGDFLLQIDPTDYESAVEQLRAGVKAAEAALAAEKANREKAEDDYARSKKLYEQGFLADEQFKNATIARDVQEARTTSARHSLEQQQATLEKASHDLKEVRITAEMSGIITALNVEEGENAIMGTLNVPGTVLLTISDLSVIEATVEVDETEIVYVQEGQHASVELDAFPDTTFSGIVTQVGNSALPSQTGLSQESVDFEVIITIQDSIPGIRPGLSASADIEVAKLDSTLAIPIQCLTVRKRSELETVRADSARTGAQPEGGAGARAAANEEIEGVFVVEGGVAHFKKVLVGLAGEEYIAVRSGLKEHDTVVSGPFNVLTDLKDGARVKLKQTSL